jgi:hypothetical protein
LSPIECVNSQNLNEVKPFWPVFDLGVFAVLSNEFGVFYGCRCCCCFILLLLIKKKD